MQHVRIGQVHDGSTLTIKKVLINVRIYHECEGGIEKSVPRITDWHHEASQAMTIHDFEGWVFLSHPHTNNRFFFLLTTMYCILYWKSINVQSLPESPEFVEMRHSDVILKLQWRHRSRCHKRVAVRFLSFPRAGRYVEYSKYNFLAHQIRISVVFTHCVVLCLPMWAHTRTSPRER